jgi:hypothetical protein
MPARLLHRRRRPTKTIARVGVAAHSMLPASCEQRRGGTTAQTWLLTTTPTQRASRCDAAAIARSVTSRQAKIRRAYPPFCSPVDG